MLLEGSRRLFYPLLSLCRPSSLWGRVVKDEIAESPPWQGTALVLSTRLLRQLKVAYEKSVAGSFKQ